MNAVALKDDAAILLRHRRYPRAAALAVTGLEEAEKALALWFLGLGLVQDSHRERLLEALRSRHKMKQATALPLRLIGRLIQGTRNRLELPNPKRRPRDWAELEEVLLEMGPAIANAATVLLDEPLRDEFEGITKEVGRVMGGDLENRRQQALYTDIASEKVESPTQVSRAEALDILRDLRTCLRALKPLADATRFPDDGIVNLIAVSDMHKRLWAAEAPRPSPPP